MKNTISVSELNTKISENLDPLLDIDIKIKFIENWANNTKIEQILSLYDYNNIPVWFFILEAKNFDIINKYQDTIFKDQLYPRILEIPRSLEIINLNKTKLNKYFNNNVLIQNFTFSSISNAQYILNNNLLNTDNLNIDDFTYNLDEIFNRVYYNTSQNPDIFTPSFDSASLFLNHIYQKTNNIDFLHNYNKILFKYQVLNDLINNAYEIDGKFKEALISDVLNSKQKLNDSYFKLDIHLLDIIVNNSMPELKEIVIDYLFNKKNEVYDLAVIANYITPADIINRTKNTNLKTLMEKINLDNQIPKTSKLNKNHGL